MKSSEFCEKEFEILFCREYIEYWTKTAKQ